MNDGIIGTYTGIPVVALGMMKMPYNEKEVIQKASYYLAGIQYEKCNSCLFYSGEYCLEPFTEELSNLDVHNFIICWIVMGICNIYLVIQKTNRFNRF